jgi:hypothetical protein
VYKKSITRPQASLVRWAKTSRRICPDLAGTCSRGKFVMSRAGGSVRCTPTHVMRIQMETIRPQVLIRTPRRQYSNWDWDGSFNAGLSSTRGRRTYRASRSKLSLVQLNCGAVRKCPKTTTKSTLRGGGCWHKRPHLASLPMQGLHGTFCDSGRLALWVKSCVVEFMQPAVEDVNKVRLFADLTPWRQPEERYYCSLSILFYRRQRRKPTLHFWRVAQRPSAFRKVVNRVVFDSKRPLDKGLLGTGENLQQ